MGQRSGGRARSSGAGRAVLLVAVLAAQLAGVAGLVYLTSRAPPRLDGFEELTVLSRSGESALARLPLATHPSAGPVATHPSTDSLAAVAVAQAAATVTASPPPLPTLVHDAVAPLAPGGNVAPVVAGDALPGRAPALDEVPALVADAHLPAAPVVMRSDPPVALDAAGIPTPPLLAER